MKRAFLILGILVAACSSSRDVCDIPGVCGDGGDASTDVAADVGVDAPPGCDLSKDPKDSPLCISDSVGVFVDGTKGDDAAGDGSKAKPVKSVAKALSILGAKPRVYVCEGAYAGSVDVGQTVAIFGGLKCDWSAGGTAPVLTGSKAEYVLKLTAANIVLVDLDVRAKDGSVPGESSVAVLVSSVAGIKLSRTKLVAGVGQPGLTGALVPYSYPSQAALDGKNASGSTAGGSNAVSCPGGSSTTGGAGGDGAGQAGGNGLPALGAGQGGTAPTCGAGGFGKDGNPGASASPATSITILGALTGAWVPTAGAKGSDGGPGQGGGGGYGSGGGGGGGGGAGGCGGAGAGGGGGGGASLPLVSIGSVVSLVASELVAAGGGKGGAGIAGQAAQPENGFGGNKAGAGCQAGSGGKGGNGGSSGGGAGGISVGILYTGTRPTTDVATDAKIATGAAGTKGIGGSPGTNDGIDGVAQAVLEVK